MKGLGTMLKTGLSAALVSMALAAAPALAQEHVAIEKQNWSFAGVFGTFDQEQLQRGFQVFESVCANCHGAHLLAFRNLSQEGGPHFSEAQVKALAATAAYFAAFVVICSALWTRRAAQEDLFAVLGARRIAVLAQLEAPAALPAVFAALQLAIPAALLGAVIGEWFGSARGIGPLLINSMQNYDIPLLWAAGVLTAVPASIVYGGAASLARRSAARFGL